MDSLPAILALGTLGFVLAFAYVSIRVTEKQLREGGGEKSALSRDGIEERLRRGIADAS